jgi:hypothetical protein
MTIEIKLVRTNVFTRWHCHVCGGHTEKVSVLAEGQDQHDRTIRVCERCLECGDIDQHLEMQAASLIEEASAIRSLIGQLRVPTFADWCREEEQADRDDAVASGCNMTQYDAERAAFKRGRADRAAGKTEHDMPLEYYDPSRDLEARAWRDGGQFYTSLSEEELLERPF